MISLRSLLLEIASEPEIEPAPEGTGARERTAEGVDLPGRWIRIGRLCQEYGVSPLQAAAAYRKITEAHPGLPVAAATAADGEVIYGLLPCSILGLPGRRLLAAFLGETWASDATIAVLFGVDVATWRKRATTLEREGAIRVEGEGAKRKIWPRGARIEEVSRG